MSSHGILNVFYHGVTVGDGRDYSPINIPAPLFERQIAYFKKEYDILTLREAFQMYRDGVKPKRKSITISFDDGYRNNLTTALPILERYGAPATFFVCSVITDRDAPRWLWTDVFYCLKYFCANEIIEINDLQFEGVTEVKTGMSLSTYIKAIPTTTQRDELLTMLTTKYQIADKLRSIPAENWQLLSADELRQFAGSPLVEIGSHGHLHYNLGVIPTVDAQRELSISKTLIEGCLQQHIDMIAYPDGSYTLAVKDLAQQAGYGYQMAVDYRCVGDEADTRILNRYGVSTTTTYESAILNTNFAFEKHGY
jgi:peptidoglycan/xylan/chitin deacetylase (PgdA/CDA1 family)